MRALGTEKQLRVSATPEVGWTEIEWLVESPISLGLPRNWHSFSRHFEEVASLPPGFRKLARSPRCDIQACEVIGKPAYGLQFHPERAVEGAESTIAAFRGKIDASALINARLGGDLHDEAGSRRIFENFYGLGA